MNCVGIKSMQSIREAVNMRGKAEIKTKCWWFGIGAWTRNIEKGVIIALAFVLLSRTAIGETISLSPVQSGSVARYREDGTTAAWYTGVNVGFYDGSLGNDLYRAYYWFNIPSSISEGIITDARLVVRVANLSQWNSYLNFLDLNTLGNLTYSQFTSLTDNYVRYVALNGHIWQDDISKSSFNASGDAAFYFQNVYALQSKSQMGFSIRAAPESVDDPLGDQTYLVTLSNPQLIITYTPADTSPNDFSFIDQINRARNTACVSDTITISGINKPTSIPVS
jgi:hypothetical protein